MAIKPYLQLVRLPNLFTAAADPLAGWLLTRGGFDEPARWGPLVAASVLIYAGGIVLNDVFDHDIDLRERPERPLPSGQVSRGLAAAFGWGTLLLGILAAFGSGSATSGIVAAGLVACVLAYDGGMKRTPLGPQFMGACRGLSFLLGMSQAPDLGGPAGWLIAASLMVFVAGVTWISRSEVETGQTRGLVGGLVLQNLAFAGLTAAFVMARASEITLAVGLAVLTLVGLVVDRAGLRAYRDPVPATFQKAVKTGVLSLVWIDVAAVMAARGPAYALAVALLWVPAFLIGRRLYST
ncbi:UbiA family prenyltransferase [Tundrisphaera sp. TA3]|uniref:UbiA family prenyltransferase n=1 Tax=Tundrisphaera sp. TA3 TaxID=3435775 RepID=UPI003EB81A69